VENNKNTRPIQDDADRLRRADRNEGAVDRCVTENQSSTEPTTDKVLRN